MPNLVSLRDLTPPEFATLVGRSVNFAGADRPEEVLSGRAVGIYFSKASTRTRTSFWRAATRLGAEVITYGPDDLQLTTGESREDTARVLSLYLDGLVVRTNGEVEEIRRLGSCADLAVINALSSDEHPTQAVADLATLTERFGDLSGRHLLYVGEGNSSAAALAFGTALTPGFRLTLLCPPGYGVSASVLEAVEKLGEGKAEVEQYGHPGAVAGPVDAVYTSRWQQMGVPKANTDWLQAFHAFRVDRALLDGLGAAHTIFMHDLPAVRGQEVDDEVLDGPRSIVWRQSYHKITAAMAVLEWCTRDGT